MNTTFSTPAWTLARDDEGYAWLTLDCAGASANTLRSAVLEELDACLAQIESAPPAGLVLRSGKAAGFIAGADVDEFSGYRDGAAARAAVARVWAVFDRLAALPCPTLALIRGHCLGGGLELALACRYRIAVDEPATRLGLPEVMIGVVPGWGGMARLPRLIGAPAALDLMLSGRQIDARTARKLGLADEIVPPRVMDNAARMLLAARPRVRRPGWLARLLGGPLRRVVASRAERTAATRARREHYPAPFAIIDTWLHFDGNPLAVPAGHPASLEHLLAQGTAANLLRVFALRQRLKGIGREAGAGAAVDAVRHVHVVGAGVMGGDIAAWCATQGYTVTLQDHDIARIAPAIRRAHEGFARKFRNDRRALRDASDRLIPDPHGGGVRRADVIIEAIFEDLDAKHALFRDLEARARPEALLATNTSSLRLEEIATALREPSRLVGLHFFNPVAKMPLVEVVAGAGSDPACVARALAFAHLLDKLPLPVKSAPGFLVNAVLGPYLLEAIRCVDEGIAPETVDAVTERFGMPMGPIELADTVGLDIALATGQALTGAREVPAVLAAHVAAGKLGRKSGEGFYRWEEGRAVKDGLPDVGDALRARLLAPLLNAAQRCVSEGVVEDVDLADAGIIFGAGFAPWTGGPLHYRFTHAGGTV